MNRTAVIHQPDFMPYIGFFHRLLHCDVFVILDDAQFVKGTSKSWMNRDKIKTQAGEKWITVGVEKVKSAVPINQVKLATTTDWRTQNLNQIRENYRKAPYYEETMPVVEQIYANEAELMWAFNYNSINVLMEEFNIEVPVRFSSELGIPGSSNERLVGILKAMDCDGYLSGLGARDYYDPAPFDEAGITVQWQEFEHPVYPQLHGDFIPYLSSIDLLFNCGREKAREILKGI